MEDRTLIILETKLEEMTERAQNNWDKVLQAQAHIENGKRRAKLYREEIRKLEAEIERLKNI